MYAGHHSTEHATIFCIIANKVDCSQYASLHGCTLETWLIINNINLSVHLCFHFKGFFSKGKASNIHEKKFFEEFVCGDLKEHCSDNLVKLEVDGEHSFLHFTDVDQVNLIYVETKHKGVTGNYFKIRKNYVKSKAKKIADNGTGSLRRVSKGVKHMYNKKYLKYEVDKKGNYGFYFQRITLFKKLQKR